ncbi:hypothetical protein BU23DRAFT_16103 [Bimuria novae-zelandiae CBS 107.79]|uniref:Uncharacterized protein n=1 Tax=Bimuria novae-zelandiae CBS 107.79 TaxID=1447943 RepID=A0A6A5VJT4_9PLEO|nr:hypothetical protein BU23DRAFT_16103 [Bimuria novae-zelandiae CBS 107.79]
MGIWMICIGLGGFTIPSGYFVFYLLLQHLVFTLLWFLAHASRISASVFHIRRSFTPAIPIPSLHCFSPFLAEALS